MLESVPDQYKTQEMCDKVVDNSALIAIRLEKQVTKPSIVILLQYNLFMNTIKLKKMRD